MKLFTVQDLNEGDLMTIEAFAEKHRINLVTIRSWRKMAAKNPEDYPRFIVIGKTTFISQSDFVRLCNRKAQERKAG